MSFERDILEQILGPIRQRIPSVTFANQVPSKVDERSPVLAIEMVGSDKKDAKMISQFKQNALYLSEYKNRANLMLVGVFSRPDPDVASTLVFPSYGKTFEVSVIPTGFQPTPDTRDLRYKKFLRKLSMWLDEQLIQP